MLKQGQKLRNSPTPPLKPRQCLGIATEYNECDSYLDEVVLLGTVLIKHSTRSRGGHKEDGLEGDFALSGEVDMRQGFVSFLLETEKVRSMDSSCQDNILSGS